MSEEEGLLGGLPKTRPGVETPRRAQARRRAATAGAGAPDPAPGARALEQPGLAGSVEQLARRSAGAATGTAAAGLRLAGRAAGGLGKALTRR